MEADNSILFITILFVMPLTSHRIANRCWDVGMWQEIAGAKKTEQFKSPFVFSIFPVLYLSFIPWQVCIEIFYCSSIASLIIPIKPYWWILCTPDEAIKQKWSSCVNFHRFHVSFVPTHRTLEKQLIVMTSADLIICVYCIITIHLSRRLCTM